MRVTFSSAAREDLNAIWMQIAMANPVAADRIFDRIMARCLGLRDHPELGPARPEISPDARMIVIEKWLSFYRVSASGIQIVRIVDGRRDLSKLRLD